jgi:hypothetical protein
MAYQQVDKYFCVYLRLVNGPVVCIDILFQNLY